MLSEREPSAIGRWTRRWFRLALGLLAGMATVPVLAVIGFFGVQTLGDISGGIWGDNPHLPMGPQGQSITDAGASTVIWRGPSTVTGQTCRGACDDLLFQRETPRRVEIRGPDGRCVVCDGPSLEARLSPWRKGPAAVEVQIASLKGERP